MKLQVVSSWWVHCEPSFTQITFYYLILLVKMKELYWNATCRNLKWENLIVSNSPLFCSTGVGLDPLCSHSVLCEGDHRGDPAWRGPQRSRVVWSCSAVGLSAGSCDHVPSGQCVQLFFLRGPMQHKLSLNKNITQKRLEEAKALKVSNLFFT